MCDGQDAADIVTNVALNRDLEILFILVLNVPIRTRLLSVLAEIGTNFNSFEIFAAEYSTSHKLFSVAVQSAEEPGGKINLSGPHYVGLLKECLFRYLHRCETMSATVNYAIWNKSFRFGWFQIAGNISSTHRLIRANGIHVIVASRALCTRFFIFWI